MRKAKMLDKKKTLREQLKTKPATSAKVVDGKPGIIFEQGDVKLVRRQQGDKYNLRIGDKVFVSITLERAKELIEKGGN